MSTKKYILFVSLATQGDTIFKHKLMLSNPKYTDISIENLIDVNTFNIFRSPIMDEEHNYLGLCTFFLDLDPIHMLNPLSFISSKINLSQPSSNNNKIFEIIFTDEQVFDKVQANINFHSNLINTLSTSSNIPPIVLNKFNTSANIPFGKAQSLMKTFGAPPNPTNLKIMENAYKSIFFSQTAYIISLVWPRIKNQEAFPPNGQYSFHWKAISFDYFENLNAGKSVSSSYFSGAAGGVNGWP